MVRRYHNWTKMASANDWAVEATPLVEAYVRDTTFLRCLSIIAALYLLAIYKRKWHINVTATPLVLYIGLNLPSLPFNIIRGEFGKWIMVMVVTSHIFYQQRFPDYWRLSTATFLLLVTVPHFLVRYLRNNIIGANMSMIIGAYLLNGHIRSTGLRQAFGEKWGFSSTVAIILLLISPLWEVYNFI
eukprot:Gb_40116 [translate_table: standard]